MAYRGSCPPHARFLSRHHLQQDFWRPQASEEERGLGPQACGKAAATCHAKSTDRACTSTGAVWQHKRTWLCKREAHEWPSKVLTASRPWIHLTSGLGACQSGGEAFSGLFDRVLERKYGNEPTRTAQVAGVSAKAASALDGRSRKAELAATLQNLRHQALPPHCQTV